MTKYAFRSLVGTSLFVLLLSGCGTTNNTATTNQNPSTIPQNAVNATRQLNPAGSHRITSEQAVANRVVKVSHVRSAAVLVAGNTAYVAVEMRQGAGTKLTQQTKDTIIRTVKANHPELRNVLVTANPDAYSQFQTYTRELGQGKPVTGMWNRFNSMVQRLWPNGR